MEEYEEFLRPSGRTVCMVFTVEAGSASPTGFIYITAVVGTVPVCVGRFAGFWEGQSYGDGESVFDGGYV